MSNKLTDDQIKKKAIANGYEYAMLKSIIRVESGGTGFDKVTGKIIIQFEPSWYKRKSPYTPSGLWTLNGVERQSKEWLAFNNAFNLNPDAAMESTSIGIMQVMGFHHKLLGFRTVGAMWDFAKISEANQLELAIRFMKSNKKLDQAVKDKNFKVIAFYYNGEQYEKFGYHTKLQLEYNKSLPS